MPHRIAGLAATLIAALTFAACGGDSGGGGSDGGEGVKITHKFGTTTVPANPKRVVSVGYNDHEFALALGVEPVAIRDTLLTTQVTKLPWSRERIAAMKTKPVVLDKNDIDVEEIAKQQPDLILGIFAGLTKRQYDTLSKIAPTIPTPKGEVDFGAPWQDQLTLTGRVLGREDQARKLRASLQGRFDRARKQHPEFSRANGLAPYVFKDTYGAYANGDLRARFLNDLGFTTPPAVNKLAGNEFYVEFSKEQFRLLEQDALLFYGGAPSARAEQDRDPLYSRLKAVREGRVVYMDNTDALYGAVALSTPYSLPYAIREATPRLAAAVDGDPTTKVKEVE